MRAVNSEGGGAWSLEATATPPSTPDAPTDLSATAGNGRVTLTYSAPTNNGGSAITGYEYQQRIGDGTWGGATAMPTTKIIAGLTNGTQYGFQVRAENSSGKGAWSDEATATPAARPDKPTRVRAARGNRQITLTYAAPSDGGSAITDYYFRLRSGNGVYGKERLLADNGTITGLLNGRPYDFQVRAKNSVGKGAWSDEAKGTPSTMPDKPTGVTATAGNGRVTLTYSAPTNNGGATILGYRYQKKTETENWPQEGTWLGTTTTGVVEGLNNGTAYRFRVQAVNIAGQGAWSASTPLVTPTAPTQPVTALTVSIGTDSYWVELNGDDEAGLVAVGKGGTTKGAGTFTFQEKEFGTWTNMSGAESGSTWATIDVKKLTKGMYTFRAKLVAGGQTAYSDPIEVNWVEKFDPQVNNPWKHKHCSSEYGLSWKPAKQSSSFAPHRTEIRVGTPHVFDFLKRDACIKARFHSETSGSENVRVSGTAYHYQKKIKTNDRDVMRNIRSDDLTLGQLKAAYGFTVLEARADGLLDCTWCKGGFVETNPVSMDYGYLKTHRTTAYGDHIVNNRSLSDTDTAWDQPMKPLPEVCDRGISAGHIATLNSLLVFVIITELVDILDLGKHSIECKREYGEALADELKQDLPPRKIDAVIDRVKYLLIWPKGAQR